MPAKIRFKHAAVVPMLAVAGCASLVSVHYDPSKVDPPLASYPYALSEGAITVLYTVVLNKCGVEDSESTNVPAISVTVSATISMSYPADPDQYFYVPTANLKGMMKNANVKFTTAPDGTLQGLNGEMADQSLQVVGAGLQTVASIAGDVLTGGVNVPRTVESKSVKTQKQGKETTSSIPIPADVQAKLNAGNACSKGARSDLDIYNSSKARLATASKTASKAESPKAASAADAALTQVTTQVADALKKITFTVPIVIVPKAVDFNALPVLTTGQPQPPMMKAQYPVDLARYISKFWIDTSTAQKPFYITFNNAQTPVRKVPGSGSDGEIAVYAVRSTAAAPISDANKIPDQATAANDPASDAKGNIDGLVLRQPAVGLARTCLKQCADADNQGVVISQTNSANADLAPSITLTLPQLGKRIVIPLHTHVGDDVAITATLAPDGAPTVLSLANTSTLAQGLTSMTGAANAYSGALTAQNTAIGDRNSALTAQSTLSTTNATLNDTKLKAQADCYVQQAAIVKAGGTPVAACQ